MSIWKIFWTKFFLGKIPVMPAEPYCTALVPRRSRRWRWVYCILKASSLSPFVVGRASRQPAGRFSWAFIQPVGVLRENVSWLEKQIPFHTHEEVLQIIQFYCETKAKQNLYIFLRHNCFKMSSEDSTLGYSPFAFGYSALFSLLAPKSYPNFLP